MWGRRFLQRLVLGSRPGLTTQLQNPQMGETSGWRRVFGASLWLGDLSIRFTDGNTEAQGHPVMNVSGAHWMQTPPPGSPPLPLTPMLPGAQKREPWPPPLRWETHPVRSWPRPSPGTGCSVVSVVSAVSVPGRDAHRPRPHLSARPGCGLPREKSFHRLLWGQARIHRGKLGLGCGQKTFPIAVSS